MPEISRREFTRRPGESDQSLFDRMAAEASFLYMAVAPDPPSPYNVRSETIFLPDGVVVQGRTNGAFEMVRTTEMARNVGDDMLMITFIEAGAYKLRTDDAFACAGAGDILLLTLAAAFRLHVADHSHVTVLVSRGRLPTTLQGRDIHGACVHKSHPLSPLLGRMARTLAGDSMRLTPDQAGGLLRATLDLFFTALTEVAAQRAQAPSGLRASLRALIDMNLQDSRLSPARLAAQAHISRATLYRVFEDYGGVTTYILDRRLERVCSRLATNPDIDAQQLASPFGFRDVAQLKRAFGKSLGLDLDEARRQLRQGASSPFAETLLKNWGVRVGHPEATGPREG